MDKITLSLQQLQQAVAFIKKRGFQDEGVIVEILDHFACKIEEKMTLHPRMAFDEAMVAAHHDFGTLGFQPLLAAYEAGIRIKYRAVYKSKRNELLSNPGFAVPVLIIAVLFYFGYLWADTHAKIVGFNLFAAIIYLAALASFIFIALHFRLPSRNSRIFQTITGRELFWVLALTTVQPHAEPLKPLQLIIAAGFTAIACFYLLVRTFTLYATLKVGKAEADRLARLLEAVRTA
jgi:hypothetical protein